jgi:HlyD family secretion protein
MVALFVAAAGALIWHYTRADPIEVAVKPVEGGTVERTVANTRAGTVKACRRAKLSPSIGGQIAKLPIREGDTVKAGQLLLELWNEDLLAETKLAQREANTAKAHARAACLKADVSSQGVASLYLDKDPTRFFPKLMTHIYNYVAGWFMTPVSDLRPYGRAFKEPSKLLLEDHH